MAPPERELELAGVRQRILAGVIDSGMGLGVLGGLAALLLEQRRPDALERLRGVSEAMKRLNDWTSSPRAKRAQSMVRVVWTVATRNARGPGMRAMHIRRVDARTGGPVTVRSALRRIGFQRAWSAVTRRVTSPTFARFKARAEEMQPGLDEVRRTHPDDPRAQAEFARSQGGGPAAGCCGVMLAMIAIEELPVAFTARRQTLSDWAAGIAVVRD